MARRTIAVTACLVVFLTFQAKPESYPRIGNYPSLSYRDISAQSAAELRRKALDLAYNLDHDEALQLLRRAVAEAPSDPAPHRALASVLWLHMLFLRGSVTVDHYLGSFSRAHVDMKKPPPELDSEFRKEVQIAIDLARDRVKQAPRDAQARYDLGAALGLQASYIATVEGKLLAGFRAARSCFDEHERALRLDSNRADAALAVGMYRYVVSTLSLPMRLMAYVAGFGGGKDEGIRLLQRAAASDGEARTDALFALILVYNRERRFDDALKVLETLRRLYPRNRLVLLEEGATALRGGRAADAERILSDGLQMLAADRRRKIPGEAGLWHYKRGAARVALRRQDAIEDLRQATGPDSQGWVAGRARVELARIALRSGDRQAAVAELKQAESLCQNGNDPLCVEAARALARSVNGG
jgi:tetratricopeptide (TPR) repeat protein